MQCDNAEILIFEEKLALYVDLFFYFIFCFQNINNNKLKHKILLKVFKINFTF
jgi:hypothetical protein